MSLLAIIKALLGLGREAPAAPSAPPESWPAPRIYTPGQVAADDPGIPAEIPTPVLPPLPDLVIPALPPAPLLTGMDIERLFPQAVNPEGWAAALDGACRRHGIVSKVRLAAFLAQVGHESTGLTRLVENLNYAATALPGVFNRPGSVRITTAQANLYGRTAAHAADQQAIANTVYGGAWGRENLGNVEPGDGWRFRGRGLIQITGRANYTRCATALGISLLNLPAWLETQAGVVETSAWWWEDRGCNALADSGDFIALTKRINGGLTGIDERMALLERVEAVLA